MSLFQSASSGCSVASKNQLVIMLVRGIAGIAIAVVGRPPYLVRSDLLPHIRIYLQGLKVRVPPGTLSMQLFAAKSLRLRKPEAAPEPEKIHAQS